MPYFEYSKFVKNIEYFEILEMLMERWECEIIEFKEAKGGYDIMALDFAPATVSIITQFDHYRQCIPL